MSGWVSSTIQGQGHGGLGSLQGGSRGSRGPGRPAPATPAQPCPGGQFLFLGSAIQGGMEFPGKPGTGGTFEFTNGIKSIYIFMTTGKFQLVDRNGEM